MELTSEFAIEYLLDDCQDCPENEDGECVTQSHCFEVKQLCIKALRNLDTIEKIKAEITERKAKAEDEAWDLMYITDEPAGREEGFEQSLAIIGKYVDGIPEKEKPKPKHKPMKNYWSKELCELANSMRRKK